MAEFIWISLAILLALGLAFVYFRYIRGYVSIPDPVETMGEIIDIEEMESPRTMPMLQGDQRLLRYYPIIRFRVSNTQLVRFRHIRGAKEASTYQKGQQVKVVYSKKNPLVAKLA